MFFFTQCPVTCGGGVRSRTVTCALAPKKTCDMSTKPRSRSLCGLQSCPNSSLRRKPGPPPKYRRIIPPKSKPTTRPASSTWAPRSTTSSAAPTTAITVMEGTTITETTTAFIPSTTSPSVPKTTIPEIRDTEDGLFNVNVRKNGDKRGKGFPPKAKDTKATGVEQETAEEREDGEEGSTPNVVMYTPGYDYVVEERMTEEGGIIDLDVTTSASFKSPLQSSTPTPLGLATPTLQTSVPTTYTSEAAATYTYSPHAGTKTWARTTHHYAFTSPHTTHRVKSHGYEMNPIPLTTPNDGDQPVQHMTLAPSTLASQPATTAASPRSTIKIIKLKKPTAGAKRNSSASYTKKPSSWSKNNRPKNQNQRPENPRSSSTGDQSDLNAREPVSMDIFWVVGNWSEVGEEIFTTTSSYLLKRHASKFSCFCPLTA